MIQNVRTGMWFETVVAPVDQANLRTATAGWRFDWYEQSASAEIYGLVASTIGNETLGLIALQRVANQHVEVALLEFNPADVGRAKRWRRIAGNLFAFAARLSIKIGGDGFLALYAKSELLDHYKKEYGFQRVGKSLRMILDAEAAAELIQHQDGRATDD